MHIATCNGQKAEANLRCFPGGPIIGFLPNGLEFQPQALSRDEWYYVKSDNGNGWIHRCFIDGAN